MSPQRLLIYFASLIGGAIGLFGPVGAVKWLMQTEPDEAGILTFFFVPVWCLLVIAGLLAGWRLGLLMTGGKQLAQR